MVFTCKGESVDWLIICVWCGRQQAAEIPGKTCMEMLQEGTNIKGLIKQDVLNIKNKNIKSIE